MYVSFFVDLQQVLTISILLSDSSDLSFLTLRTHLFRPFSLHQYVYMYSTVMYPIMSYCTYEILYCYMLYSIDHVLSGCIMSCHIILYHKAVYCVESGCITSLCVLLYCIVTYRDISGCIMSCGIAWYQTIHIRSFHIISDIILYHNISYHLVSYHIILYHISYCIISYRTIGSYCIVPNYII